MTRACILRTHQTHCHVKEVKGNTSKNACSLLYNTQSANTCKHQLTFRGLCCDCGFDTSLTSNRNSSIVSLDFLSPGLKAKKEFVVHEMFEQDFKSMLQNRKLRLVIDLDETLVHSKEISKFHKQRFDGMDFEYCPKTQSITFNQHVLEEDNVDMKDEDSFGEEHSFGNDEDVHIFSVGNTTFKTYFRPYVMEFLDEMSRYFEIYVYTNGTFRYAKKIIDFLCKKMVENSFSINIQAILARKKGKEKVPKRLHKMLCKRAFSLIIDDQPDAWCQDDQENILNVSPFKGNQEDDELSFLAQYLKQIHSFYFTSCNRGEFDVRRILKNLSNQNNI